MSTEMTDPPTAVELREYVRQAEAQKGEAEALVRELSDPQFRWHRSPDTWSIGEHLVHLAKATRPYLVTIDAAVARARSRNLTAPGPYRHGWLGDWFVRGMEPPPRMRIRTMKALVPVLDRPREAVLADFLAAQDELVASLRAADGVDLGRARIRSPFFKLLRLSVGQAYGVILAHNRRHFWHIRQLLADPRFPGG